MTMTAVELFTKACEAWGVEMSPVKHDTETFTFRRQLIYEGKALDITWSPEVAQDLRAFHGAEAETKLVMVLIEKVIEAIAMPADSPDVDNRQRAL